MSKRGIVFKIITDSDPDIIYIGSTVERLCNRMCKIRTMYKHWINGKGPFLPIYPYFKGIGLSKFRIVELQRYLIEDKQQLKAFEDQWIEKLPCVNKHIVSIKETFDLCNKIVPIKQPSPVKPDSPIKPPSPVKPKSPIKPPSPVKKMSPIKNTVPICKANLKPISPLQNKNISNDIPKSPSYKETISCPKCSNLIKKPNLSRHLKTSCKMNENLESKPNLKRGHCPQCSKEMLATSIYKHMKKSCNPR